jgi:hypothetical protein
MTSVDDLPFWLLEGLASRSEQVRYIVGGTADEYILPDELLNDASHFCELASKQEKLNCLSETQASSIARLAGAIDQSGNFLDRYDRENIAALIDDPTWASLRQLAAETLLAFGKGNAD